jgi:hypothetical protein
MLAAGGRNARVAGAFLAARAFGYGIVGALLAAGVSQLGQWAGSARALQPLWTGWHLLALAWGLVLVVRAEQPRWLAQVSARWLSATAPASASTGTVVAVPRPSGPAVLASTAAGLAWVAWPCGLLQSALLMASLANDAGTGAALMVMFACVTSAGLWMAPALWRRLGLHDRQALLQRLAGGVLVSAALWALAQRTGFVDWCLERL